MRQTADKYQLSQDQFAAFAVVATTVLNIKHGVAQPPLRALLIGGAGCGKTQVLNALIDHCWQHDAMKHLTMAAYTWRAALHIHMPPDVLPAATTSTSFQLNTFEANQPRGSEAAMQHVDATVGNPERLIGVDEFTLISMAHLGGMSCACKLACSRTGGTDKQLETSFAGHHMLLVGDILQHPPVTGRPLWGAQPLRPAPKNMNAEVGYNAYKEFTTVFRLTNTHRFAADDPLARFCAVLTQPTIAREDIAALCNALHSKAIKPGELETLNNPHIVMLRHSMRGPANLTLAARRAAVLHAPMVMWHARDHAAGRMAPLTDELRATLRQLSADQTGGINGTQYFFPGIEYLIVHTKAQQYGIVHNQRCIGRAIVLHPHEHNGEERLKRGGWLHHPPAVIFVEPDNSRIGAAFAHVGAPFNTFPICVTTVGITVKLPNPISAATPAAATNTAGPSAAAATARLTAAASTPQPHKRSYSVSFTRTGMQLGDAYVVTDYYAQGMSFRDDCWIAHLAPPDDGHFKRAAILVVLSRFKSWEAVRTLCALWPEHDAAAARTKVIDKFFQAAQIGKKDPLKAELVRLNALADATHTRYAAEVEQLWNTPPVPDHSM